jgi:HTH-type transcriptional regulator/antitoxin HipB
MALALGRQVRAARNRRGLTQAALAERVGVHQSHVSKIERGLGGRFPLELWLAVASALGISLRVELGRDPIQEPPDAGHLAMQELALRLGRETGRTRTFELPTRPTDPALSVDVCLRDDRRRILVLEECWNTFGSINASARSTRRKIAEAEQLAATIGGPGPAYRVAACWIVRDTRRNRELLARYPEIFASTFTGSSAAWVRALTTDEVEPPADLGLVWTDVRATRLIAWRRQPIGA